MAKLNIAYIGGGSTRAPGTVASFIRHHARFDGSTITLIDLDAERLNIVRTIAEKMARNAGADIQVRATTDRRAGLEGAQAILTSYRPGNFEARVLDERIPLSHGVIGQETQGPGGFFMALRSIHAMKGILADIAAVCPGARLYNYTNPINIVSQAITTHSPQEVISLCEGPITFGRETVKSVGLDPERLDAIMIGLNHACWSVRHEYDGQDVLPLLDAALDEDRRTPRLSAFDRARLELACTVRSLPAAYMQYYFTREEVLREQQAKPTTRAQDILAEAPAYWRHYREQAASEHPVLDPKLSRGGIFELELAVDVMAAIENDSHEVWPVNVPNQGALPDFAPDQVVEVPALCTRHGAAPLVQPRLPQAVRPLMQHLAEYQRLAADAAWSGSRREAIQALAANPLVPGLAMAATLFDEMSAAQAQWLPRRLGGQLSEADA